MGMLLAPKLMGFIATMFDRDLRRGCGGAVRTFIGMLLETLLAALMAPVTMYVQSRRVAEVLAGKDSGWESQRRAAGSLPFSSLLRSYGGLTFLGVLAAVLSWSVSPAPPERISAVLTGPVLSDSTRSLSPTPAPANVDGRTPR